jgi:hypothetical protein
MACNSCGNSASIRVERSSQGPRPSAIVLRQVIPLRPRAVTNRKIRPANHLDKR